MNNLLTACIIVIFLSGCMQALRKFPANSNLKSANFSLPINSSGKNSIDIQYLGCGGLFFKQGTNGILIDPFFSSQRIRSLARSVLSHKSKNRTLCSRPDCVDFGLKRMETAMGPFYDQVDAIFTAHSHYDHLMDVPVVFSKLTKKPPVFVSRSGYQICQNVIDPANLNILEDHMTTQETMRPPIELKTMGGGKVRIYPILADHNPHYANIKFFDGSVVKPIGYFRNGYDDTAANDWLQGNTFSFLLDFVDPAGTVNLRVFVQSSSCHAPAGMPPSQLLAGRKVDIAFLGVASYEASPEYPKMLLDAIAPAKIVWIHWEDFFRKYTKDPKGVRATDVAGFYKTEIVEKFSQNSFTPWPGVKMSVIY